MIKYFNDSDLITDLWKEAFSDSDEDILYFLQNCKNKKCLGFFDGDLLCSMLFLIECTLNGEKSYYIYAACTYKSRRNRGDMSALLDYCKKNYDSICLIPADNGLINFYKKRGLNIECAVNSLAFINESESIVNEYLLDGFELDKPLVLSYKKSEE